MGINQVAKISGNRLVPSQVGDEINPNIIDLSEDPNNLIEKRTNGLYVGPDSTKLDQKQVVDLITANNITVYNSINDKVNARQVEEQIELALEERVTNNDEVHNNFYGDFNSLNDLINNDKEVVTGDYAIVKDGGIIKLYMYNLGGWQLVYESDYEKAKKMNLFSGNDSDWVIGLLGAFLLKDVYVGTSKTTGLRLWFGEATTTNQNLVVYPTSTGTANGTALFSDIVFAIGVNWHPDGGTINSTHLLGGNKISNDKKSIHFYNVKGGSSGLGGAGLQAGDSGKIVKVIAVGIPRK